MSEALRVCILLHAAGDEFDGGVPGSFTAVLARELAARGHPVTALLAERSPGGVAAEVLQACTDQGVELVAVPPAAVPIEAPGPLAEAYEIFEWLRSRAFDLVHVPDCDGGAFYAMLARAEGLALPNTRFCVHIRGPHAYERRKADRFPAEPEELCRDFMDARNLELADHVIAWNPRAVEWLKREGWATPSDRCEDLSDPAPDAGAIARDEARRRKWIEWHARLAAEKGLPRSPAQEEPAEGGAPLVSICLAHYNRPRLLLQAVESIRRQDYPSVEAILIDDASTEPDVPAVLDGLQPDFHSRDWIILREPENRHPGAVRNLAARQARGNFLLFMDDDDYAMPHEVSTLVRAALRTGADIVTPGMDYFESAHPPDERTVPTRRKVFLGGAADVGFMWNVFGPISFLVRREAFVALGGFSDDYGLGHEDWEFLARAALAGCRMETVPMPLFWYRRGHPSRLHATSLAANLTRIVDAYTNVAPRSLRSLLRFAMGRHLKCDGAVRRCAELEKLHRETVSAQRAMAAERDSLKVSLAALESEHTRFVRGHEQFVNRPVVRIVDYLGTKAAKIPWLHRVATSVLTRIWRRMRPKTNGET